MCEEAVMIDHTLETLAHRLERLERRDRCWRAMAVVVVVGVSGVLLMGQAGKGKTPHFEADVIEAHRFVVKDSRSNAVAGIGVLPEKDTPFLFIKTLDDPARTFFVGVKEGKVYLDLFEGTRQASLSARTLMMRLDERTPRVLLSSDITGNAQLVLFDQTPRPPSSPAFVLTDNDYRRVIWRAP
jgi:hypothetical protein